MTLTLHTIAPASGARTKKFRIGRGNASGRGTTAGRGTKGQRARSGGRNNLKLKGLKQMLLSFPKLRGFQSQYKKDATVTLEHLVKAMPAGGRVDLALLKAKSLVPPRSRGAKIVGSGPCATVFTVEGLEATEKAKAAIQTAGGSFVKAKTKKASPGKDKKASSR